MYYSKEYSLILYRVSSLRRSNYWFKSSQDGLPRYFINSFSCIMCGVYPNSWLIYSIVKQNSFFLDQKYYFEILHKQGEGQGHLHVAWKMPGWKYFTIITKEFLSLFVKEEQGRSLVNPEDHVLSDEIVLRHHKHVRSQYRNSDKYRNFTKLTRAEMIPLLRNPRKTFPVCNKEERKFTLTLKRYQGIR